MAPQLSRKFFFSFLFTIGSMLMLAQTVDPDEIAKDYKDPDQFQRFYRRRNFIAAWQINQLKHGALVVKLKTNQLLIDQLKKQGNDELAEEKRLETIAMNDAIIKSYSQFYHFSKVYFIYSNNADTLLKGAKRGIFLNNAMQLDPSIQMTEDFYLIAESDRLYNSSIGFLPEDSAAKTIERGNPTGREAIVVVKNKYGHQLKRPFPFFGGQNITVEDMPASYTILVDNKEVPVNVGNLTKIKGEEVPYDYNGKKIYVNIDKERSYNFVSKAIENFDMELTRFYQANPEPRNSDKMYAEVKPFLY